MILVYSEHITPRLQYILGVFSARLGLGPVGQTSDREAYLSSTEAKINYSTAPVAAGEFHISPAGLLAQTGIQPQTLRCFDHEAGFQAFFAGPGPMGFDVLAAAFYLLSRHEEYGPHEKDSYGRYAHENSLAFREGFLKIPLVDLWIIALREKLQSHYPALSFSPPPFHFLPTYDIDMAWSYRQKGPGRNLGGWMRQMLKGQWKEARERIAVLRGKTKDPFDSFEQMDQWHAQYNLHPVYFFLLAEKNSRYDKNISPYNFGFRKLVKQLSQQYQTGIHPSWQTGDHLGLIKKEMDCLLGITGQPVHHSRQHYIRMEMPRTLRQLAQNGILHDYSMGYGSINGFRASAAFPFYWYDLENEETTSLLLHPFCFMDANSFYEQKQTASQTAAELQYYFDIVKKVSGEFSMIWHNPFFGTDPAFAGWRELYADFLAANFTA